MSLTRFWCGGDFGHNHVASCAYSFPNETRWGDRMAFELKAEIAPTSPLIRPGYVPPPPATNPLGALADLPGTWVGKGFNQIWRPFHGPSDRFLELNLTEETLEFSASVGAIPNRG